jgi:hydrogenase/urease accessory protein HupE
MWPVSAEAHVTSTGIGPFYDGLAHFLMNLEDVIPVLALALLAGLRGVSYGRRALFTLPIAWLFGAAAGLRSVPSDAHPIFAAGWFLLFGGLVAADADVSLPTTTALAMVLGLSHGYLNGTGMGRSLSALVILLGLGFAIFVSVALVAASVVKLRAAWGRIAVRVGGSWIASSGLLMLGWAVRTK